MSLAIYLTFNGDCEAAFEHYRTIFGGEIEMMSTFADGPPDMGVGDADKDKIMHVSLRIGDSVLMGSDSPESWGGPVVVGGNFSISYIPETREEADRLLPLLAEGGEITMPLADMFWNAYFGMCRDKFGVQWMLNVDHADA